MRKLNLLERVFSITNEGYYKIVRFFCIPFKIDRRTAFNKKYGDLPLENKIVFSNFFGSGYGCNPKYIHEEILKEKFQCDVVWLVKDLEQYSQDNSFPPNVKLVYYKSEESIKELATARIWINNQRLMYHLRKGLTKKEGQYYIQTWHGSLGIKKLDADVQNFNTPEKRVWVRMAKHDSATADYLLSNSDFEDKILPPALWFNNKILKFGHPRNDIFFKSDDEKSNIKKRVFKTLEIPEEKKVLLYVPSFRDNKVIDSYDMDYKILVKSLEKKFGGNWVIVIRLHPRLKSFDEELIPKTDYIVDGTYYPDIQELLVSADIVVTDYSSCIFDFMLSRKPGFIYASDIKDFDEMRGFYYPLTSTPFPVSENNEQLQKNISEFDYESYKQKVEDFLKEKGSIEDGHASERVVEFIKEKMNS